MFMVFLRFTQRRDRAASLAAGHKQWVQQGLADGVFLLTGSLPGGQGGVVLAHQERREALEARVRRDPFVAEGVVTAEILELTPSAVDERLGFVLEGR